MYYVRIQRLNGRYDFYRLVEELNSKGFGEDVEYFGDGDIHNPTIYPHLRFINEGDAVAFCLANGCTYSTNIPENVDK